MPSHPLASKLSFLVALIIGILWLVVTWGSGSVEHAAAFPAGVGTFTALGLLLL